MAKGIGLIGNFRGKVGNMVGYNLKDSNNKQTQGVRVYQPVVKNPKTAGQAEQRAKLAPVNATYRALKSIIDRGNEGLPYGNKSRLAWLKNAFKAENMPWFEKGKVADYPIGCLLTKGSLQGIEYELAGADPSIICAGVSSQTTLNTVGGMSTALMAGYPSLKAGDQVTFVCVGHSNGSITTDIRSIVIDTTSADAFSGATPDDGNFVLHFFDETVACAVIVSREGENGAHLRSNSDLVIGDGVGSSAPYDTTSKTAAIKSYMTQAGAEGDWAEESLKD